MAERPICPNCSLSIDSTAEEHFRICANIFRCPACNEVLGAERREAHLRECRSTPCTFCRMIPGEGGLQTHLPKCLAAFKCVKCSEYLPVHRKYLHESRCKPAPAAVPKVSIECEVCHGMYDNTSKD